MTDSNHGNENHVNKKPKSLLKNILSEKNAISDHDSTWIIVQYCKIVITP